MTTEQSVRPKPSEPAGAPSNEELIEGLDQDLGGEYKTIIKYVVFSATLKGRSTLTLPNN
ncbi:MAG TPA: hypothetical protein VFF30_18595 [Nitrososphaerales archaeon]|nr:hypothetical protein [Nitrososphaerales archaeon]